MTDEGPRYYGIYPATVDEPFDPSQRGAIRVTIAGISDGGVPAEFAAGFAGPNIGMFARPPQGTPCWVMFVAGDTRRPVVVGFSWRTNEVPATGIEQIKVFATSAVKVTVSDVPGAGGVTVEVGAPAVGVPVKLTLDQQGVNLSVGGASLKLTPAQATLSAPVVSLS